MSQSGFHLLVIDPQNDFCDLPQAWWAPASEDERIAPALPVPGAHDDMLRLAAALDAAGAGLDAITLTLDSHQRLDIGHPGFWRDAGGDAPAPFTPVSVDDLRAGRLLPRDPAARERVQRYLEALAARGRYTHMVWPVHCQLGSWGQAIHAGLLAACNRWEDATGRAIVRVSKGENPWTEHYSAVMAEVPLSDDPATGANAALLARLATAERLYVAGEAGSHCVRATVEHLQAAFAEMGRGPQLVLISDCMSPVAGFEAQQAEFLRTATARGARMARLVEARTEWAAHAPIMEFAS